MVLEFKRDKYREARGAYSRMLNISCRKCKSLVAVYQKDGPGNLRRMYLDRIFGPASLVRGVQRLPVFKCKECGEVLGTLYVYEKEKRKAFRIYQDAVIKKVRKLNVMN